MIEDYLRAKKIGDRQVSKSRGRGEYPYLPALDDMVSPADIAYEEHVGLLEIPTDQIVGTKTSGRSNAFSRDFMPVLEPDSEFATKWSSLYDSQLQEGIRDAIKVYEYRRRFYVQEGNKRVSITKYVDVSSILGDVTRVVPKWSDDLDTRIYYEFLKFYRVCPFYEIAFTQEGGYERLAEVMGENLEQTWHEESVELLRSAFRSFERVYFSCHGDKLSITAGDAFLIYTQVYDVPSIIGMDEGLMMKHMGKLWTEFLVADTDDKISLVETPDAGKKDTGILGTGFGKRTRNYTADKPLKIGFVFDKTPDTSAWNYSHELGRNHLADCFEGRVSTKAYYSCATDEDVRRAVDDAASEGCEVVFTISPSQMPETLRSALHFPDIRFMNCSINLSHTSVRTYYGKMFEAKYLMGALAATAAENHRIGYLEGYPLYGSIANINAFAVGAAMVDPKAEIYLSWSSLKMGEWWQEQIIKEGIKVFSGQDLIAPSQTSMEHREYGVYIREDDGSTVNLATPVWDWGRYYELIVKTIFDGSYDHQPVDKTRALNYWWGMGSGVIDVIMSQKLSYQTRKMITALRHGIVCGNIHPFDGELRSTTAIIQGPDGGRLSNDAIIRMDWLCDNVIGEIPRMDEIRDEARSSIEVSGVVEDKK